MNNLNNLNEIFAPTMAIKEPEQSKTVMYNPSAKNSKNGKYTACIRFIPWHKDPNNSVIIKQQAYLKDPLTSKGRYIDSKRTVNEQCPIADTFWTLYNTKNAAMMDFAKKHISLNTTYTALIQVIQDEQHPELVGKILPWRFGKTIWDKLYQEQHPSMGTAYNPFDIINGRYFAIDIVQKAGWNNYDNCRFFDYRGQNGETSGMLYKNASGQYMITTNSSDKQEVYNFLVNETPDFDLYAYRQWTPEDNAYVTNVLTTITNYANTGNYGQNVNMAVNGATMMPPSMPNMPNIQNMAQPSMLNTQMQPQMTQPSVNVPTMGDMAVNMNTSMMNEMAQPKSIGGVVMGVDLPDVQGGTPEMPTPPSPVVMGGDLESLYGML